MHDKSVAALSKALQAREISSVELTQLYLQRIKQHDEALNAYISITEENALEAARHADARISGGSAGALTGIPIAHKSVFCTEGVKSSSGSMMLDAFVSPYNATVVERLADAGCVMLGTTNMDEFAMGSSTESSYYGPTRNPWDTERVPGGSSGGSAAAVAARLAPCATGTDTGGSIRQPAAFCGISGLKPTYGRVSRYGMIAFASSLDSGGPFAATAEDCAMLMNAMAGFDPRDSTSLEQPVPDYTATLDDSLKGRRIGLPSEYFSDDLDADIAETIQQALNVYTDMGCELVEVELPHTHIAVPAYYVIAPAECSSNLARLDGVRYGYRCKNPHDLQDLYERSRGEGFGDEVKRRIMIGTYALSAGYYDAYYLKAQQIRRLISDDFRAAFEKVDMIAAPVSPVTAFRLGEKTDDPVTMYLMDIYTIAISLAGLPAMSIPAGMQQGLPVGLQLVGNYFAEAQILNAAHQYQKQTDWHAAIPEGFA